MYTRLIGDCSPKFCRFKRFIIIIRERNFILLSFLVSIIIFSFFKNIKYLGCLVWCYHCNNVIIVICSCFRSFISNSRAMHKSILRWRVYNLAFLIKYSPVSLKFTMVCVITTGSSSFFYNFLN